MRTIVRRTALLPVLAALAVGLVGCSDKTPGNAQPGNQTSEERSTEPTGRTTSSKPTSGDSPLADMKPCSLLSSDGAAQLKAGEGEERQVGRARSCRWRIEGATVSDSFTIGVSLHDELGIKDLPGNVQKTPVTVGKHEAVQSASDAGGCLVIMGVTDSSRVDAEAFGGAQNKACDLALQLAKLVEPELPE